MDKVLKCHIKESKDRYGQKMWLIITEGNVMIATVESCERHAIVIRDAINRHECIRGIVKDMASLITKLYSRRRRKRPRISVG